MKKHRKVAERHQAAIKEYQSCVTTGPLGVLELHIMNGGCKLMLIGIKTCPESCRVAAEV